MEGAQNRWPSSAMSFAHEIFRRGIDGLTAAICRRANERPRTCVAVAALDDLIGQESTI